MAGLALAAVLAGGGSDHGGDDGGDDAGGARPTATTAPRTDEEVAGTLLPPTSALGGDWIETVRDDRASEATIAPGDACPSGPIPEGWLIRGEQRRVGGGGTILETLSITAGVVAEGARPADLDDPAIVSCLLDGLQAQLPEGSTVAVVDGPALGPTPPGAVVAHQRFEVTGVDGTGGVFDFLLVRRGRAVSLGLLTGVDVPDPTPLGSVVAVLDAPLQAALPHQD